MNTVSVDPEQTTRYSLDIVTNLGGTDVHRPGLIPPCAEYREGPLLPPVVYHIGDLLPLIFHGRPGAKSDGAGMGVDLDLAPYRLWGGNKLLQDGGKQVANGNKAVTVLDKPCVELSCCVFVGRGVRRRIREATVRWLAPGPNPLQGNTCCNRD